MATTTGSAIAEHIASLIKAIVPTIRSDLPFIEYDGGLVADLRTFARRNPLGMDRRFQVRMARTFQPPDAANLDMAAKLVTFDVVVAYPQSHHWGPSTAPSRDKAMEADQLLIERRIGREGYGNFSGSNPNASWLGPGARGSLTDTTFERSVAVDFLVVRQTMRFYRSQTP